MARTLAEEPRAGRDDGGEHPQFRAREPREPPAAATLILDSSLRHARSRTKTSGFDRMFQAEGAF